ncbi:hypothetical protein GCM10010174_29220 [Kutzneria viridogrisea]|uniref:ANTAR domain-containing protein n=2 Tax=Kutzneria TaxID=43356 RepID=W5W9X7_9PSEU|nr:ANTAR domain-containing protein [Kutzneria albida]AHH97933.1 hypothetical protein KALB_4571 [Kutzneria albida DSM 43870]MBA8924412.1 hypothetical protein [Kutzneria viridogrisea]
MDGQRRDRLWQRVAERAGDRDFSGWAGGGVRCRADQISVDAVAIGTGLAAAFAFPLRGGAIQLGTLSLYRRLPGPLAQDELADAAVLAELATTALLTDAAEEAADQAEWIKQDNPGHYDAVNIATGMLAAQLHISMEDAFLRLRAHAFSHNRPLLEVAQDVLNRSLHFETPQE